MHRRRFVLPLITLAAALAAAIPIVASAAPDDPVLPDLVADAPERPLLGVHSRPAIGVGERLLLRFDGFVHNLGPGPLEVRGTDRSGRDMTTVRQYVRTAGGSMAPTSPPAGRAPTIRYEDEDGHNHWHLMQIARYSLWSEDRAAEVAPGQKVGFCLVDSQRRGTNGPASAQYTVAGGNFCGQGETTRSSIAMGVSAGWRDVYDRNLAFQWVDVSDVQPGRYWLAAEIDTDNVIREASEANNGRRFAASASIVPGYRATQVPAVDVEAGGTVDIPLSAESFGAPGPPTYRMVRQPAAGSVTITGTTAKFSAGSAAPGTYSFAFTVSDRNSPYPRNPRAQSVTVTVGGATSPSVAISGAPASMIAGTSAQLSASVANAAPGVTWSASAGTVSDTGLYVAPDPPPPGEVVEVRATSTAAPGASQAVAIRITPAPVPVPATGSETRPVATTGDRAPRGAFAGTRLKRNGRVIVVWTVPGTSGRIAVAGIRAKRAQALCVTRAVAGSRIACKLRLPARHADQPVRIAVALRPADGPRATLRTLSRP